MDHSVQKAIYEEYHEKILWYIFSKVNDKFLAEDICSDVFVKVFEKYESFNKEKASASTWIYTIARNTLIDYYRVRKIHEEVPEDISTGSSVEDEVCNNAMLEMLADGLNKLDEREKDLIILHYYSGYNLKETAQKIGISYAYVKILHNKALGELKKYMEL